MSPSRYDLSVLSPREREAWELREQGFSAAQVAEQLDLKRDAIKARWRRARKTLGASRTDPPANPIEVRDPVGAAEAIDMLTVPDEVRGSLASIGRELGLSQPRLRCRRLRGRSRWIRESG